MLESDQEARDAAAGAIAEDPPPQNSSRLAEALLGAVLISLLLVELLS
jgi:hypothetical protein